MKIEYTFADGTKSVVEVEDSIGEIILESRRLEDNFDRRERYHGSYSLDGRIDLIITKSVSRFARNTVDSLTTIRRLKENGIECYFEKENIWTFDSKGELLLTIMSSLAQEESRSISENVTWGHRKRFADGKVMVPFGRFLGYERGEDGNLVINEEQAKIVRRIYGMFLQGRSPYQIAKMLTEEDIPTPAAKRYGARRWCRASSQMRSTRATHSCRKSIRWISSPKRRRSTRARFRSIMWRATVRPSSRRRFSIGCRC